MKHFYIRDASILEMQEVQRLKVPCLKNPQLEVPFLERYYLT